MADLTITDASRSHRFTWSDVLLLSLVLAASTIFPRLMVIGGLPATDEGYYAYQAQTIYHSLKGGNGIPDSGPLAFYPMLLSWVFGLGLNSIVALRGVDLLVAVALTSVLYTILARESGSRIIAALLTQIYVFTLNQPLFIQHGFKNSMTPAVLSLLLALLIVQRLPGSASKRWLGAGAFTAFAVLLRETFLPFAALGFVSIAVSRGRDAVLRYCLGGMSAGIVILGTIMLLRGGVSELVLSYRTLGRIYESLSSQWYNFFLNSALATIHEAVAPLGVSAAALVLLAVAIYRSEERKVTARVLFWLFAALAALVEPVMKTGLPYHFAVSFVGLAGLSALACRYAFTSLGSGVFRGSVTVALGCVAALAFVVRYPAFAENWPRSRQVLAAISSGSWPPEFIEKSNYLFAASEIRKVLPPSGTVSVSGFMYTLYPLTGHLPPSPRLANLSLTFIDAGLSEKKLRDALLACPPDIVMTTDRQDWPGSAEITSAINNTGLYEMVEQVPHSTLRDYGHFGGSIYRRILAGPASCEEPRGQR